MKNKYKYNILIIYFFLSTHFVTKFQRLYIFFKNNGFVMQQQLQWKFWCTRTNNKTCFSGLSHVWLRFNSIKFIRFDACADGLYTSYYWPPYVYEGIKYSKPQSLSLPTRRPCVKQQLSDEWKAIKLWITHNHKTNKNNHHCTTVTHLWRYGLK